MLYQRGLRFTLYIQSNIDYLPPGIHRAGGGYDTKIYWYAWYRGISRLCICVPSTPKEQLYGQKTTRQNPHNTTGADP
jgi:hypothetical protein